MAIASQQSPRTLLTEPEVAEVLGCTARCLQAWRQSGQGPVYLKLSGMVRYRKADLDAFIAAGERRPKAEASQ